MEAREKPSTADEVGPLRRWVEELCGEAGATRRQCSDVALAVSEALSNVVMHAYVDRPLPGPMRIRATHEDHRLIVEVEDDGVGIRPRIDSPGAGMGLALIAALATELEFASGPTGKGALVKMAFAVG
jgi:anti-sigma regulatory factor (Ser/Thr protein kinase)